MTVTYGFYNSVNGDRKYDAKDFAEIFDGIIEDGVHKGIGDSFATTATGGNTVALGTGRAWFDHTWTLSDTAVPFVLDAAHASLNRIDALILEVDSSDPIRANQLKYVRGTPAQSPTKPILIKTATLKQYAMSYIYRPLNSNTVTPAQITNVVGTPETPYAVSRLLDRAVEPASMRRNVFRGKFIGTSYTAAQQEAVSSGSFEDLYLGDYWTINDMNWRIVDFDYYYNVGYKRIRTHHVVVMPDNVLRSGAMNNDFFKANAGAYFGSDMRTQHLPPMLTAVSAAFPNDRIMDMSLWLNSSMMQAPQGTVPGPSGVYVDTKLELPSQIMIFGSSAMQPVSYGGNIPPGVVIEAGNQLALFRLAPWFVPIGEVNEGASVQWTRDVLSPVIWSVVTSYGQLAHGVSNITGHGFRPYFCLK